MRRFPFKRYGKAALIALIASHLLLSPGSAEAGEPDLSGVSIPCQAAYKTMRACMLKTLAAGAPESIRPQWEKQLNDSVQMWRSFRGRPEVENNCKEIAAQPDCDD